MKLIIVIIILGCTTSSLLAQWQGTNPVYFNAGDVGIGTTSPASSLHLVSPSTNGTVLRIASTSANGRDYGVGSNFITGNGEFGIYDYSAGAERLRISSSGNVGIGTTSPASSLHLVSPSTNGTVLRIASTSANGRDYGVGSNFITGNGEFGIYDYSAGAERLRISSSGNVGIGTTVPDMKLSIYGEDQFITRFHSTGTQAITGVRIGKNSSYGDLVNLSNGFGIGAGTTSSSLPLDSQNPNHIYLFVNNSSGNVGIGTTSPDAKLAVSGQVHAQEVKVSVTVPGPDYVFEKDYHLTSLEDIKTYIDQNKHLPEVPSAKEMEKNGVQLGEMNMLLLKKIEELTLYVIGLKKEVQELKENQQTKN